MRSVCFELSNSARDILTVSVDGGGGGGGGAVTGLIVSVALRVTPLNAPLIVALVAAFTVVVLTVKFAEAAPAATVTLAGTDAAALLLVSVTTVADGAVALNLTVPWTEFPPTPELGANVSDDNESGAGFGGGGGGGGVTVTVRSRRPSWLLRILMVMF
jgi:hypothetical protein